jgi:hypothetical protein
MFNQEFNSGKNQARLLIHISFQARIKQAFQLFSSQSKNQTRQKLLEKSQSRSRQEF